jgi:hypothetical protein
MGVSDEMLLATGDWRLARREVRIQLWRGAGKPVASGLLQYS